MRMPVAVRWLTGLAGIVVIAVLALPADTPPTATVNTASLTVYESASSSSEAVKVLKRGDKLLLGIEIQNSESVWCQVRAPGQDSWLGYVTCRSLHLPEPPAKRAVRAEPAAPVEIFTGKPPVSAQTANGGHASSPPPSVLDRRFITGEVDAPDFALVDLDGNTHQLSGLRGSTVLLDFWATWCPPCWEEMTQIDKLRRELQNQGLAILAIDGGEPPDVVRRFFERTGFAETILLDPGLQAASEYSARYIPTIVIIDPNGKVRFYDSAVYSSEELRAILAHLGLK